VMTSVHDETEQPYQAALINMGLVLRSAEPGSNNA
jgi:hypothetical protein